MKTTNVDNVKDKLSSRGMESSAASSSSSKSGSTREPKCARCRNHRLTMTLKGHKRYCKYRTCNCAKCKLTVGRQKDMARKTARRRALAQDENRIKKLGEVDPRTFGEDDDQLLSDPQPARSVDGIYDSKCDDSPISSHGSNGLHSSITGVVSIPSTRKLPPLQTYGATMLHLSQITTGDSVEKLLEYTTKLFELLQYPTNMIPFLYVIVKDAGANLDEAMRRILEADNDIRALQFWKALRMVQNSMTYCCTGYTSPSGLVGAPTYEGQAPYIGMPPPPAPVHLRPSPPTFNAHIPVTRVPSSSNNPTEHPST